ncbi:MAG: tRNA lysidine(34) synthetase TilS [Alicyclobacillaceae bacterium]|nr:tRNA lysidine(34) synthetase TilS [Alicyclobacillaceae bacterium]
MSAVDQGLDREAWLQHLQAILPSLRPRRMLVACSGGLDSTVLLRMLHSVAARADLQIHVGHVHHGLRSEANDDSDFVVTLAHELGLPVSVEYVQLGTISKTDRKGLEADARRLRHEALRRLCEETGSTILALGHHADDVVETFLWRFLRGAHLAGLAGMRDVSRIESTPLLMVRPFLKFTKQQLAAVAAHEGWKHREDASNHDDAMVRNRIRRQVVPLLLEMQPELHAVARRQSQLLREEDDWLQEWVAGKLMPLVSVLAQGQAYRVSVKALLEWPLPLQRRAIRLLLMYFPQVDWSSVHIEAVMNLVHSKNVSACIHLPAGVKAWRLYDEVVLGYPAVGSWIEQSGRAVECSQRWSMCTSEEITTADGWKWTCRPWMLHNEGIHTPSAWQVRFPAALREVDIRTSHVGERVWPLGMTGSKKISDVFGERKLPKGLRSAWPVVAEGDHVLWIPGMVRSRLKTVDTEDSGWTVTAVPPRVVVELLPPALARTVPSS